MGKKKGGKKTEGATGAPVTKEPPSGGQAPPTDGAAPSQPLPLEQGSDSVASPVMPVEPSPCLSPKQDKKKLKTSSPRPSSELINRYVFIGGACHICKVVASDDVPLKICSGCRLVLYCSVEHQKKHWAHHKQLCRTIKKVLTDQTRLYEEVDVDEKHFPYYKELCATIRKLQIGKSKTPLYEKAEGLDSVKWRSLRLEYVGLCEKSLGRRLTSPEYHMLMHPISCYHCHLFKITQLNVCQMCYSVFFCSQHSKESHKKWCDDYRIRFDGSVAIAENGIAQVEFPDTMCTTYKRLPRTWKKLINRTYTSDKFKALNTAEQTMVYEQASLPLSVLRMLETADVEIGEATEFTVHILGGAVVPEENMWSKDQLRIWESWFLKLLPKLKRLDITVLSSGTDRAQHWNHQDETGRSISINVLKTPSSQFIKSKAYTKPGAVIACNVRADGQMQLVNDVKALVSDPDKPLMITSATVEELGSTVDLLKNNLKFMEKTATSKNPFRSFYPKLSFSDDAVTPIVFSNHYITLLNVSSK